MNISRFFGATNREAMRQVRLALGSEALIISNKRVNGGVEILATDQTLVAENDQAATPAPPESTPYPSPAAAPVARSAQGIPIPAPPACASVSPAPAVASQGSGTPLSGAINELKSSLESRFDELLWGNQLRRSPHAVTLFQNLLRFGFSTTLLRAMLKTMPEFSGVRAAVQWARAELIKHLPVLASEDQLWKPGLALALVGPTGVGKTTTIAKLAARCVRRNGPESLVLLTTDTYRIGAHEQLKIYGQMMRVPVHVVQDVYALRRILETVRPDQTVLIDNVGISQRDRYVADQAALLAGAGRQVERLLALNASSHGDTLDEVARSYARDGGTPLRGCVITKIDEAASLGAALDTAIRFRLPVHYVSNGQKVPENLLFLTAPELLDHALAPVQSARPQFSPTEADLAALMAITQPEKTAEALEQRRRQQVLLPQLLTQTAGTQALGLDVLQQAVARLDEDIVLSEAYHLWRSRTAQDLPASIDVIDHLHRVALANLGDSEKVWVVHDRQALSWQGTKGHWAIAAWFGPKGQPLAVANQQIGLADGWYSPQQAQLKAPPAADTLLDQIYLESDPDSHVARWHVLEGGSQALLRRLTAQGHAWLSLCGARTRVYQNDEACVVSAAASQAALQPLPNHLFTSLRQVSGRNTAQIAWWAGLTQVQLQSRGQAPLPVQLLCLRALDVRDGHVIKVWHALLPAGPVTPPLSELALAVLIRQEAHAAWRLAVPLLADGSEKQTEPLLDRAVLAAQLGLAAWSLTQSPYLVSAAHAAARMLGAEQLSARQAPAGLLKLFTLKELLSA
ncbi:flagellar biosynthesis protein FlhF [Castellaniella sp.]|uniref:flagellar biosynthesis protein FlhF n=1 Tax=Castellaniella sp. TaxID=1955812 RepID=UPI003A8CE052